MPRSSCCHSCIFFNPTAPTEIYPLSLHDALPISPISAIASTENTNSWAMRTRRVRRVRWIRRRTSSAERPYGWVLGDSAISVQRAVADAEGVQARSEERRVGKEGRERGRRSGLNREPERDERGAGQE